MARNIQELQCLMSRQTIDAKACTMGGRILKQLTYGGGKSPKPKFKFRNRGIWEHSQDRKKKAEIRQKNYRRKQNEMKEVVKYLRLRYKSISPLKGTGDFDGAEFYGFSGDSEQNKERDGAGNGNRNRRAGRNYRYL